MSTVGYLSAHIWIHQFIQFDLHQQKVKTPKPFFYWNPHLAHSYKSKCWNFNSYKSCNQTH